MQFTYRVHFHFLHNNIHYIKTSSIAIQNEANNPFQVEDIGYYMANVSNEYGYNTTVTVLNVTCKCVYVSVYTCAWLGRGIDITHVETCRQTEEPAVQNNNNH